MTFSTVIGPFNQRFYLRSQGWTWNPPWKLFTLNRSLSVSATSVLSSSSLSPFFLSSSPSFISSPSSSSFSSLNSPSNADYPSPLNSLSHHPQNLIEKIVQKYSVHLSLGQIVQQGDFVSIQPEHVMTHDNTAAVMTK